GYIPAPLRDGGLRGVVVWATAKAPAGLARVEVGHVSTVLSVRSFLKRGKRPDQAATMAIVATPPLTTLKTGPASFATRPDSNPPISLLLPMKTAFTALTRPRMWSGVA